MFRHAVLAIFATAAASDDGCWTFQPGPDPFREDAVLDLRGLNDRFTGERGFVKLDGHGDFVDGSGNPIRFWATNTAIHEGQPPQGSVLPKRNVEQHMRFLAKLGVNLTRSLMAFNGTTAGSPGSKKSVPSNNPLAVDEQQIDDLWRMVAAARKNGVYVMSEHYWAMPMHIPAAWGIAGKDMQNAQGLLFFNPKFQEVFKNWLRRIYTPVNPHTGIALKDDPTLAFIELQNEDSLLFWTFNNIDPEQKRELGRLYAAWAAKKYGSAEKAVAAWGGARPENDSFPGDDAAGGVLAFLSLYDLTPAAQPGQAPAMQRRADQLQFLSETMRSFNASMIEFMRKDLGLKCLIVPGNWKTANGENLNDPLRWSYTVGDVVAVNRYYAGIHQGKNSGWAIMPGDRYTDATILEHPADLPVNLKQVAGMPMMITESEWNLPNHFRAEGPALIAAYSALSGVDAYFWFTFRDGDEWNQPLSANGFLPNSINKWNVATPDVAGQFPAAALMYRNGYIKRGTVAVHEERPLADLWERKPAYINEGTGFDPNRDLGEQAAETKAGTAHPLSYLVGPVEAVYGGDAANTYADLGTANDLAKRLVRSNTGELTLDYGRRVFQIDTPCAQGVVGFLKPAGGTFATSAVRFACGNAYASLLAVSMDGAPLTSSKRVLVQLGTQAQPTGWAEKPAEMQLKNGKSTGHGFEIVSPGKAPWLVVAGQATVTVANPALRKAMRLDVQGYAAGELPTSSADGGLRFDMPRDALYVVLTP